MQYFFTFQMDESLDISAVEESIHDATFHDQFECSGCDYKTRYKHNLRRHQQLKGHQPPQMINLPKSSTPLKPVSKAATATSTSTSTSSAPSPNACARKSHICDQCAKEFQTRYGLSLHKRSKHEKVFKFTCQMCQRGFNQATQYRFHCANHLNVSLEKCGFCGKEFTSPGCLKRHLLICQDNPDQQDVGKFVCPVCSAAFTTKHSLNYHQQGKHQPPKYKCLECTKAYAWRSSLRAHIKFAHAS